MVGKAYVASNQNNEKIKIEEMSVFTLLCVSSRGDELRKIVGPNNKSGLVTISSNSEYSPLRFKTINSVIKLVPKMKFSVG